MENFKRFHGNLRGGNNNFNGDNIVKNTVEETTCAVAENATEITKSFSQKALGFATSKAGKISLAVAGTILTTYCVDKFLLKGRIKGLFSKKEENPSMDKEEVTAEK